MLSESSSGGAQITSIICSISSIIFCAPVKNPLTILFYLNEMMDIELYTFQYIYFFQYSKQNNKTLVWFIKNSLILNSS